MDKLDRTLLRRLRDDARAPVAALARELGVSRATVKERMQRLERERVIAGYTLRYHPAHQQGRVCAEVMIAVDAKQSGSVVRQIERLDAVEELHTVSGSFDLLARVRTADTARLDAVIDALAMIDGVARTQTSILLATKFQR